MDKKSKKTVRKWSLTFISGAFAVALAMLYILVLRSIAVQLSPPPFPLNEPYPDVSTAAKCAAAGGRWIAQPASARADSQPKAVSPDDKIQNYCQGPLKFERDREQQSEASRQMSLFVFAIGGALVVALSLLVKQIQPVAPGLMIGGIVSFFIAGIHVWMLSPGIGRLITIVIIFLILAGIGLYVFREQ